MSLTIYFWICISLVFVGLFPEEVRNQSVSEGDVTISPRIIGGVESDISQYPYMVSILRSGMNDCGGSVISPDFILTAAHCISKNGTISIRAGSTKYNESGEVHDAIELIIHPNFNKNDGKCYDIGLIQVYPPFTFTSNVQPVLLPKATDTVTPGTAVVVSGWGIMELNPVTRPIELRSVELYTISNEECQTYFLDTITPGMLCAGLYGGGKDACFGDSGSPLVLAQTVQPGGCRVQVGVVSWGPVDKCGDAKQPFGVYTNVATYRDWIFSHAGV